MGAADDIVAVGGELDPDVLVEAYRHGVFPWPAEDLPMLWYCPRRRAILQFDEIHRGRSLRRLARHSTLSFSIDRAFSQVIEACRATPRPGQEGTWITDEVVLAYTELHRRGLAHSVEAWRGPTLVGGIYGVSVDGAFSAESMFHHESGASKLALLRLVDHLQSRGLDWIDIQVLTPHMERLGARLITRREFLTRLAATMRQRLDLFESPPSFN